jgi:hypothetical protein
LFCDDVEVDRFAQKRLCQRRDAIGHGGRKKQGLALARKGSHDAPEVPDEPHIKHAIRFIEHAYPDLVEVCVTALHKVEQPARRRDDDVRSASQCSNLRSVAHSSVEHNGFEVGKPAIGGEAFTHLGCEFSRWCEYQSSGSRLARDFGRQSLQSRQSKCRGLAGSGLSACEEIAAG